MSLFSFQIDPYDVLGVAHDAPLHDIREAFRLKAKKLHPDVGGEDWAFRVLVQAYEILSKARVVRATQAESEAGTRRAAPRWEMKAATETVRPGSDDKNVDPTKLVDVEKLWIRFEVEHIWILQEAAGPHDERFLSCSLNIAWPDDALAAQAASIPHAEVTLRDLTEVFDKVSAQTGAASAHRKVEDHTFAGWLSYTNVDRAWEAFKQLRDALHARGLGVKQWTRDLIIPREWRGSE
jgi:curved DNA-binding protein CbpA